MQNQNAKKKKKNQLTPVYKPYKKGNWHSAGAVRQGLKLLLYYIAFAFAYVILGAPLQFGNATLRIICNLALVLCCGAVLYMNAARHGDSEVALGEIMFSREAEGKPVNLKDRENSYHPLKGLFVLAVAAVPILLITVPFAVTAEKQVYALQSLPSWVSSYGSHDEIAAPLSYYQREFVPGVLDYLRLISRVLIFPFANIASISGADAMLTMDRLSPILALIPAMGYPLGYRTGPRSRALTHGSIASSRKRYVRKEKKAVAERKRQREEAARKKNELI